ncbi:MAG: MerR family transcriptional regulator [Pseudonocardiales bacterium]|nr:MerR family transcriptional regulator [Actinomycetota bacterium]PZS16644.1 MAG: MerR family transcriptional regulator [Pseudonocardiales bacterium]
MVDELTIAELATRTGISVRTIRFYTGLGLIPPPVVRGRLGLYDECHAARLQLIRDLQELGFTLAAIEGYLARIPLDRSPEDLALHRALLAPWLPEAPEIVSRAELDARAGRILDDDELAQLATLGVIHSDGDAWTLTSPEMLSYGLSLLGTEIDFAVQLASAQIIEAHTSALATELVALFHNTVLREYRERGRPPELRDRLIALLERLKPVTVDGVVTNFQLAVNRAIRESVPASAEASSPQSGASHD